MKSITDVMGDVEYKEESAEVEEFDVTSILPGKLKLILFSDIAL